MKIMIASDIHGSAYHCRRLLDAFDREGAGRLLLLGDILYHGPRNDLPEGYAPKEVTAMLNDRKSQIFCVRGNCDTEVDQMVLEFPILADYCILMLESGAQGTGTDTDTAEGHEDSSREIESGPESRVWVQQTHIRHSRTQVQYRSASAALQR